MGVKMKWYQITPINHPELGDGEHHLIVLPYLTQNLTDYYAGKKHVILDNGAWEGTPIDFSALSEMAQMIMPEYLVCPDVLYDKEGTFRATNQFLLDMKEQIAANETKLMVVPQGKTVDEVVTCAFELEGICPSPPLFGLPKHLGERRAYVVQDLINAGIASEDIHLLGFNHDEKIEFQEIMNLWDDVRSFDTAYPIKCAQNNKKFNPVETPELKKFDFLTEMTEKQLKLARKNVALFKDWLSNLHDILS